MYKGNKKPFVCLSKKIRKDNDNIKKCISLQSK